MRFQIRSLACIRLLVLLWLLLQCTLMDARAAQVIASPDSQVVATIDAVGGELTYAVTFRGETLIETSPLGLTVNGWNLSSGVLMLGGTDYSTNETFPSRHGIHSIGTNHFNGRRIPFQHPDSGLAGTLNVRVYDQGLAFRYEFAGGSSKAITAEATGFVIPIGSTVWHQNGTSVYEGVYGKSDIVALATNAAMGPPVVVELPGTTGFLALTESVPGVFGSPFLRKTAGPTGRLLQVQYPVNQGGGTGATSSSAINTPWNVLMIGADLNGLVNNDIVESLAPAPDPVLFPEGTSASWLVTGRSVWDWLRPQPGGITYTNAMTNSLWASRLGFEFNTVDEGWAGWNGGNPWSQVQQVVDFSQSVGVKVLLWKRSSELNTAGQRATFFQQLTNLGVAGFKADFFDFSSVSASAAQRVKLQEDILREAAAARLLVNFHGCTKPMGQFRTYPNLLEVEAVFGKEQWLSSAAAMPVPFTRFLAGPADFTPMEFGGNRAYEIATVINMPGPMITFAERSDNIARSAFASLIRTIPTMWDETRVLSQSKLGETCATARRIGDDWYIGIMNTGVARNWALPLTFLEPGVTYQAHLIRENSTTIERLTVTRASFLSVIIASTGGSGFVAKLFREPPFPISSSFLLNGTIIGTAGSWNNSGNTRERVFDGNLATYFDAPTASGAWVGLDLGAGSTKIVTTIRYCPRPNWASRMVAGVFQGAHNADFSDATTLHVVGYAPVEGAFTTVTISNTTPYRFVRYLSPPDGSCNVAEIQFYGAAIPTAPVGLSAIGMGDAVQLNWTASAGVSGYNLKRADVSGGPYTVIATNLTGATFTDTNVVRGEVYYYVLSAQALAFEGPDSAEAKAVFHDLALNSEWDGNTLKLVWPGSGALLESTNVLGPWTTNANAVSPFHVNLDSSSRFFRIQVQ